MKCPKCGYLGFESVERCRNCGYDFSLTSAARVPDLSIRSATDSQPLADLAMVDAALPLASTAPAVATPDLVRTTANASAGPTPELPLFGSAVADDVPLITRPSPPRTPLAVRRATPEVARVRGEGRTPSLDLRAPDTPAPRAVASVAPAAERANGHGQIDRPILEQPPAAAAIGTRVLATLIDLAVLASIDLLVAYLTLQISGLEFSDLGLLPKTPLLAFLVVQNVSYFVAFTAGGQTLGQMATAIKVIREDDDKAPTLRSSIVRTFIWVLLAVPAGLGLVTLLFGDESRGLHDRAAGTRVVRASS